MSAGGLTWPILRPPAAAGSTPQTAVLGHHLVMAPRRRQARKSLSTRWLSFKMEARDAEPLIDRGGPFSVRHSDSEFCTRKEQPQASDVLNKEARGWNRNSHSTLKQQQQQQQHAIERGFVLERHSRLFSWSPYMYFCAFFFSLRGCTTRNRSCSCVEKKERGLTFKEEMCSQSPS